MRKILGQKFYSMPETAKLLGISYPSMRKIIVEDKAMKGTMIGKRRFFSEETIRAFLREELE